MLLALVLSKRNSPMSGVREHDKSNPIAVRCSFGAQQNLCGSFFDVKSEIFNKGVVEVIVNGDRI